jgi:hypothetical protein
MKPYANESEVVQIEGLTIENRMDRISIYGEMVHCLNLMSQKPQSLLS